MWLLAAIRRADTRIGLRTGRSLTTKHRVFPLPNHFGTPSSSNAPPIGVAVLRMVSSTQTCHLVDAESRATLEPSGLITGARMLVFGTAETA